METEGRDSDKIAWGHQNDSLYMHICIESMGPNDDYVCMYVSLFHAQR